MKTVIHYSEVQNSIQALKNELSNKQIPVSRLDKIDTLPTSVRNLVIQTLKKVDLFHRQYESTNGNVSTAKKTNENESPFLKFILGV